jgi:hypothetical protein
MKRSWAATMTTMLGTRPKRTSRSRASRDPRRLRELEEPTEKAWAARTLGLELESAHQTMRAASKTNSRTTLRKRNSSRGSLEPVESEK